MSDKQKIRVRIIGTLLAIFTVAFLSVPFVIGGHPGEMAMNPAPVQHLT